MAKKFNIAELLPESERVSESDTLEIREIPWEKIRANEANFYGVKDVEDLKKSIEMHGLLDPIVVTPAAEDGFYTLISGHRRHKAWGELRKENPEKYSAIPAIVRSFGSSAMAELALIMANSSARVLTPAEVSRQAERVERLLYDLKEQGYEFTGRMRDQVAKACQVSSSKLARLKVIREKLSPAWAARWEKNELPEEPAYQLARLPAEFQERLAKVLRKPTAEQISHVAEQYEKGVRWVNDKDMKCPDGTRCQHFNSFLIHDAKCYSYSRCHGKTCCLKCRDATGYGACQSACSKAVAMRKDQKAQEEAKAEASRKRETTKLRKSMTASAARLARALDAGDPVADDEKILPDGWYGRLNAGEIRAMAAGTFDKWDSLHYSWDPLLPEKLSADMVRKLSNLTGVSADWLMGLSEEMFPETAKPRAAEGGGPYEETGGWRGWYRVEGPDVPPDGMRCIVWDPDVPYMPDVCIYRDGAFWNRYEDAEEYEAGCWWAPWPDMPDDMRDVMEEDEDK